MQRETGKYYYHVLYVTSDCAKAPEFLARSIKWFFIGHQTAHLTLNCDSSESTASIHAIKSSSVKDTALPLPV